jgi:hypothetical protein
MIDATTARKLTINATCAEYLKQLDDAINKAALSGKDYLVLPDHMTRINSNGCVAFANSHLRGELSSRGYSTTTTKDNKISIGW